MNILAIDPGTTQSGYCILNQAYNPLDFGKVDNEKLVDDFHYLRWKYGVDAAVIEQLSSYGNAIGDSVLMTALWSGRFNQKMLDDYGANFPIFYVKRKQYVTELTNNPKAKDSNVTRYLIDRFEPNATNHGKGTKKNPSRFYGMSADAWQACAISVWSMDNYLGNKAHI